MNVDTFVEEVKKHEKALNNLYYGKVHQVECLQRDGKRLMQEKVELTEALNQARKDLEAAMKGQEWLREKCKAWEEYCSGLKEKLEGFERESAYFSAFSRTSRCMKSCCGCCKGGAA